MDKQLYNDEFVDVTWETCTLRKWLNTTFLKDAFTEEEQTYIATTTVRADRNPEYNTDPGNDTEDKIFLLSVKEAETYFQYNEDRRVKATEYAIEHGAGRLNEDGYHNWWLRTPGYYPNHAVYVWPDGTVYYGGCACNAEQYDVGNVVRPALWLEIGNTETKQISDPKPVNYSVGDTLTFGSYEQDGNTSDGKEPIEWQVLDKQGDRILIISKYALDTKTYNEENVDVTWETCTLRRWLNTTFLNAAFITEEQSHIVETTVTAHRNPKIDANPGNDTKDKIFILSIQEADTYFTSDDNRQVMPTEYTVEQGAYVFEKNGCVTWWLRTPGRNSDDAAIVMPFGTITYGGYSVGYYGEPSDDYTYSDGIAIRPVLWLEFK